MRTETITRTVYTYQELMDSDEVDSRAKDNATEYLRGMAWHEEMITESLTNDLEYLLCLAADVTITSWSGFDQRRHVGFRVQFHSSDVNNDMQGAPTLDLDGDYEVRIKHDQSGYFPTPDRIDLTRMNEYGVWEIVDEDDEPEVFETVRAFANAVEAWLTRALEQEIMWFEHEDQLAALAEDNGFEFTADGEYV